MTTTQFLGAFNDNVFKQLVLLICLDYVLLHQLQHDPYQFLATLLFTIPFVIFSGLAGFLSDKISKRTVIISSKVAELVIMACGMAALYFAGLGTDLMLWLLMVVIFVMGTQSAYFGPSKYGILPEMLRRQNLPAANGIIQMTTFLAIIFGTALAGLLKLWLGDQLWIIGGFCVAIALAGTVTATLVRHTPVAQPHMRFSASALVVERSAFSYIMSDRLMKWVLLIYAAFWFAGGVMLPTINAIGKLQLGQDDFVTSLLNAAIGAGIAMGCITAGVVSRRQIRFSLVKVGGIGVAVALVIASLLVIMDMPMRWRVILLFVPLAGAGVFAGLLAVPLQVFLQARAPTAQKGRIIGAMNLITWIGILLANFFYFVSSWILGLAGLPISWTLVALSVLMVAIAILFRPTVIDPKFRPDFDAMDEQADVDAGKSAMSNQHPG